MKKPFTFFLILVILCLTNEEDGKYYCLKELRPNLFSSREREGFLKLNINIDKNAIIVAYVDLNNDKQYDSYINYN